MDFTVSIRHDCVLAHDPVPLAAMTGLVKMAPKGSVLDNDVARMANATLAIGLPEDLERLRAELE